MKQGLYRHIENRHLYQVVKVEEKTVWYRLARKVVPCRRWVAEEVFERVIPE